MAIPVRALVDAGHLDAALVVEVESMLETAHESRKVESNSGDRGAGTCIGIRHRRCAA
jgi:hypothetical protein